MRGLFACIAALTLCGCAISPAQVSQPLAAPSTSEGNVGNWQVQHKVSRLTDETSISIGNVGKNVDITGAPGPEMIAVLGLGCIDGSPSVFLDWGWPVGENGAASVAYRFDTTPARQPEVLFLNTEIFALNGANHVRAFLDQLPKSRNLYVQVSSRTGTASAEFDVSGAEGPLAELYKECPMPADRKAIKNRKPN